MKAKTKKSERSAFQAAVEMKAELTDILTVAQQGNYDPIYSHAEVAAALQTSLEKTDNFIWLALSLEPNAKGFEETYRSFEANLKRLGWLYFCQTTDRKASDKPDRDPDGLAEAEEKVKLLIDFINFPWKYSKQDQSLLEKFLAF